MPTDPNLARYIFASVATYLKATATDNDLPVVVEGLDERTEAFLESTDHVEIRVNGPFSQELAKDCFRLWVDANVLLTSRMDANKNGYTIQRLAGIFQAAMDASIPIWNYGDQPGDFDPLDPATQKHLGCLSPRTQTSESIKVLHFGQVEKTDRVKQSIVDARYQMYLGTS
jgi:hypothetical protein